MTAHFAAEEKNYTKTYKMSEFQRIYPLSIVLGTDRESSEPGKKLVSHVQVPKLKWNKCSLYRKNMVKNIRKHYGTLAQKGIDTDMEVKQSDSFRKLTQMVAHFPDVD